MSRLLAEEPASYVENAELPYQERIEAMKRRGRPLGRWRDRDRLGDFKEALGHDFSHSAIDKSLGYYSEGLTVPRRGIEDRYGPRMSSYCRGCKAFCDPSGVCVGTRSKENCKTKTHGSPMREHAIDRWGQVGLRTVPVDPAYVQWRATVGGILGIPGNSPPVTFRCFHQQFARKSLEPLILCATAHCRRQIWAIRRFLRPTVFAWHFRVTFCAGMIAAGRGQRRA
jgi:hypothetical protein